MRFAASITVLLLLALPLSAQDFASGAAAYQRGDYQGAFEAWQPLHPQGDAAAILGLSVLYSLGRGLPGDLIKGHAVFVDAFRPDEGGLPRDTSGAIAHWRGLAEEGEAGAQYLMGLIHNWGRGVPQDYFAAVNWYHRAAVQGIAVAQSALAEMYEKGYGVPRNPVQAYRWYRSAARQGDARAADNLRLLAGTMSAAEIERARRLSEAN
jgi:TPR repeat protein